MGSASPSAPATGVRAQQRRPRYTEPVSLSVIRLLTGRISVSRFSRPVKAFCLFSIVHPVAEDQHQGQGAQIAEDGVDGADEVTKAHQAGGKGGGHHGHQEGGLVLGWTVRNAGSGRSPTPRRRTGRLRRCRTGGAGHRRNLLRFIWHTSSSMGISASTDGK